MQKKTQYSYESITVSTFNTCDDATRKRFKDWALRLKPNLDGGEYGADEKGEPLPNSAYLWALQHNATAQFTDGGVYQTFIFLDNNTGEFLATCSIVPDDRDIAKKYKIGGRGFWGFVNVRRDLRGRGLGTLISSYMDEHIQKFVDGLGEPTNFSLFTANEIAVRIYQSFGFHFVRQIHIEEFDADEDLYTKTYIPSDIKKPVHTETRRMNMSDQKFGLNDLSITTYREAGEDIKVAFQALVLGLTPDQDDENGPDTWQWVVDNNANFTSGGLYATFIYSDRATGEILATGTFTPDDRGALKENKIEALGVFGFVNVLRRELRGMGLGSIVLQHLDDHVQKNVNGLRAPQHVYLFTATPGIYAKYGFRETGLQIPFLGHDEPLCLKTYVNCQ